MNNKFLTIDYNNGYRKIKLNIEANMLFTLHFGELTHADEKLEKLNYNF